MSNDPPDRAAQQDVLVAHKFYELLLRLTGRSGRLERGGGRLHGNQERLLAAFLDQLQEIPPSPPEAQAGSARRRQQHLNAALSTLGIKTVSPHFFDRVMGGVDFRSIKSFQSAVERFCVLTMLDFGSFRFGFKELRQAEVRSLESAWRNHFPDRSEIAKKKAALQNRSPIVGITEISPDRLFVLGYLAVAQTDDVNKARDDLRKLLQPLKFSDTGNEDADLKRHLEERSVLKKWHGLVSRVNLPEATDFAYGDLFLRGRTRQELLPVVLGKLDAYSEETITTTREIGRRNTDVYLASRELDVYIATSMRNLADFASMARFVRALREHDFVKDLNLRYFDPTQSYVEDRIQKGLLECLMVKLAKMTIYNAQEGDTWGKDSEASISLALGKPVVVYVARFFSKEFADRYTKLDELRQCSLEDFVERLVELGELTENDRKEFMQPGVTKSKVIERWAKDRLKPAIDSLGMSELLEECHKHGYLPAEPSEFEEDGVRTFVLERIIKHEQRANQFADGHPLALQTAVDTGVANGVMVARTVGMVAQLTRRILCGGMEYRIDWDSNKHNVLLREKFTGCPVRVVTRDEVLATAFWDSYLQRSILPD